MTTYKRNSISVLYAAGESRYLPPFSCVFPAVDYMLATIEGEDEDIELYAEATPIDGDECGTYDELKAAILEQAAAHGIPADALSFQFD